MRLEVSERLKYRLLVGSPTINWLNRMLRPSNWLARLRTKKVIRETLAGGGKVKLYIGCARCRLNGSWLHADIHRGDLYIDALKPLPFENNQVDFIFSEQFIEHLPEIEMRKFWKECFRVLKPGGWMRHATVDLEFYIKLYRQEIKDVNLDLFYGRIRHIREDTPHPCIFMNEILQMFGHVFNYDEDYLKKIWDEFGFISVRRVTFGESSIPELSKLEQHGETDWVRQQYILIMEAQKPG